MQTSIWEKESFYSPKDIIIVGSGFVGLWSAYWMKKKHPGLSITIVDSGIIPTGASTRNAGFACFGSVTELVADMLKMGEDNMLEIVEKRYKGLKKIRKTFHSGEIDYEEWGGYELISEQQQTDFNILRSNIDWLNHKMEKITGKHKVFRINNDKIKAFGLSNVKHLIENKLEGQLHSGKLCMALLNRVQSMGVLVLNTIKIKSFEKHNGQVILETNHHFNLSAKKLLICTNAFAKQLLPDLDIEPARGQILLSSAIPDLPFKGTFHYDEGFYYFRNLGNRVLLGGARNKAFEEEKTHQMMTTDTIQHELERFLREVILPGHSFHIEDRWSGIMGMGSEKKPIVKKVEDQVFCAVRMSGMGVALAPVIGEEITAMMTG